MKLYDSIIRRVCELEKTHACMRYPYNSKKSWPENEDYECIFQKDTGLVLGDSNTCGCNMICATTDAEFFHGDETVVIGPDMGKLKDSEKQKSFKETVPFARIVLLLTEEILPEEENSKDVSGLKSGNPTNVEIESGRNGNGSEDAAASVRSTEKTFRILQQMDFVKYHIFPKGYMVRASGQSCAEQVRVSKKALAKGISFERIGNTYLKHYKENPKVLQAKIIFITASDMNFAEISDMAKQAENLRNSLSVIMKGIETDCGSCSIREICNEIEGLKELHFGKEGIETSN